MWICGCPEFSRFRILLLLIMVAMIPQWARGEYSLRYVEGYFDGDGGLNGLDAADSAAISGDGKFVYVTGRNDQAIAIFSRDTSTGVLTYVQSLINGENGIAGLDYPDALALSPAGEH